MLRTLAWSFSLALIVVYGLLAAQLRSFGLPLLALAGVPMAAVGAVAGHFLLGYELTNMSVFGIVAIAGVAVNDTLISARPLQPHSAPRTPICPPSRRLQPPPGTVPAPSCSPPSQR